MLWRGHAFWSNFIFAKSTTYISGFFVICSFLTLISGTAKLKQKYFKKTYFWGQYVNPIACSQESGTNAQVMYKTRKRHKRWILFISEICHNRCQLHTTQIPIHFFVICQQSIFSHWLYCTGQIRVQLMWVYEILPRHYLESKSRERWENQIYHT